MRNLPGTVPRPVVAPSVGPAHAPKLRSSSRPRSSNRPNAPSTPPGMSSPVGATIRSSSSARATASRCLANAFWDRAFELAVSRSKGQFMSETTRRRVLKSILTAPALFGLARALRASAEDDPFIASAAEARDVFDFERLARAKLPPAHWGYLKTGVDGDATLHANDAGFANYSLRVRRLVDISRIDTSISLFGTTWQSPIFLDPVGSQRAFHADGEIASAKAARSRKQLQILST